ncbi:hypothetical protein [Corallococcus carmarthensis]|uniref:hypothetical protein n=1 Tax=Corallococcus carmarthensis TaxID=2316728 RepID=UPI00148CDFE5|nr:hypothetical protein [Corallococcus carmarthensis]NOK23529.1 hypothetical protein [Corallococcus carmarthensis]
MTILEPVMMLGAALGGLAGAIWGFGSGILWAVAGLLGGVVLGAILFPLVMAALGIGIMMITQGPRAALCELRGKSPPERR